MKVVPILSRARWIATPVPPADEARRSWEQSLLAIGCEAAAEEVTAPLHESRADFIAGKVDRHPGPTSR
jgi:hypothetical protein